MIEKIVRIANVGRFRDYKAVGDVAWGPLTLIYAENGQGKTTVAAILRSLKASDASLIEERCTLGGAGQPTVELRTGGTTAVFQSGAWTTDCPAISVFDPAFVHENVHAGDTVEHEHKKNLLRFALGETGVKLATRVTECDAQIREVNGELALKRAQIQKHIAGDRPVEEFVALAPVPDVDKHIEAKERDIVALTRAATVAQKPGLSELSLPGLPFDDIGRVLAKAVPEISTEALRLVGDHIAASLDERAEEWVAQGTRYMTDERCPFCGREVSGVALVSAYQVYFGHAYTDLVARIEGARQLVAERFSDVALAALEQAVHMNGLLLEFWREYVNPQRPEVESGERPAASEPTCAGDPSAERPRGASEPIAESLRCAGTAVLGLLADKAASPLKVVPPKLLAEARGAYAAAVEAAGRYNQNVAEINRRVAAVKGTIQTGDLSAAKTERDRLQNAKVRYSGTVQALCENYLVLEKRKAELEAQKSKAKADLDADTVATVSAYGQTINAYLRDFGADFSIVGIGETPSYKGGRPSINYRIRINDVDVEVQPKDASHAGPCFRSTLSSGDRSALAFAFYMARIDAEEDPQQRIVVFDDPVCSLDRYRRVCTRQHILRAAKRAGQVVVLSHDPYFLRMLWEGWDKAMVKTLQLARKGAQSALEEWDVERETQGEYFANYSALIEYRESGPARRDLRAVARCIRPLLEGNLRMRFPGSFGRDQWLGGMIVAIREAPEGDILHACHPVLGELSAINEYSKKYHHDQTYNADQTPVSAVELDTHIDRTVRTLAGILSHPE